MIVGPGIEIEIDESKFGRRKYNRGRQVDGHWVFGGIERVSGECFLVEVQQRDANTLLPLIAQYIFALEASFTEGNPPSHGIFHVSADCDVISNYIVK